MSPSRRGFRSCRAFAVLAMVSCFLVDAAVGGPQASPSPAPEHSGLSGYIREAWKATLTDHVPSTAAPGEANAPRVVDLVTFGAPAQVATVFAGGRLVVVDAASGGIRHVFDVPAPRTVIKPRGLDDFLVSYVKDKTTYLSRINSVSTAAVWTTKHDLRYSLPDARGKTWYGVSPSWSELPEGRQISLLAIGGTTIQATLSIIDLESGTMVRDDRFDLRRVVKDSQLFLYRAKDRRFEIYDPRTGTTTLSGTTLKDDVKSLVLGQPLALPGLSDTDMTPILTDNQLILTSRDYTLGFPLQTYDVKSSWVRFDLQGRRLERLEPSPKSAADFVVKNVGSNPWPLILGHFKKGSQYSYCQLDKFLQINERAEIADLPLPTIAGEKTLRYRKGAWFRNDSHMFALIDGSLFKWAIGRTESSAIFVSPAQAKYEDVVAADPRYAVLARFNDAVLVRLEDGQVVDPKDFNASLGSGLWRQALELKRSHADLPREGLPAQFKKYVPFDDALILPAGLSDVPSYVGYRFYRIWGDLTDKGGDVLLAPCLLKDGSSRLVGIRLPEHTVLFSVPVLGLKEVVKGEFDGGYYFPFGTFKVDASRSLLVVFEGLNQVRGYLVSRPQ